MTDKQKSKCVQWMIDGALLSKQHPDVDESFLRRATKLNRYEAYTLDKEHPSIKYKMFKNIKLYKNILYNGTLLTPVPYNSDKKINCSSCYFGAKKNCPAGSNVHDDLICEGVGRSVVFMENYQHMTN